MPDHAAGPPLRPAMSPPDGASTAGARQSAASASTAPTNPRATVLVIGGGDPPTDLDVSRWPDGAPTIAADAGVDHARRHRRRVDLVVGDLDSVSPGALEWATDAGAALDRHEVDKDQTDLELALDAAREMGATRIVITAVSGGRLDHLLANLALACSARYRAADVDIVSGSDRAYVVRGHRSIPTEPGQLVTLIPMLGSADAVTTNGLRFGLEHESLSAGSPRGVSNRALADRIEVAVESGVLLVILPKAEAGSAS